MYITIKEAVEKTINFERIDILPIYHTTIYSKFQTIFNEGKIKCGKDLCPVLGHKAIFFFYGRPAYKPSSASGVISINPPVCFEFPLSSINQYNVHLFPFDSGGFSRFGLDDFNAEEFEYFSGSSNLDEVIKKYIACFYDNNQNYLESKFSFKYHEGKGKYHATIEALESLHLGKSTSTSKKYGEQAFVSEIQVTEEFLPLLPKRIYIPYSRITNDNGYTLEQIQEKFIAKFNEKIDIIPYDDACGESIDVAYVNLKKAIIG